MHNYVWIIEYQHEKNIILIKLFIVRLSIKFSINEP